MLTVDDFTDEEKETFLTKLGYVISDWRIEDEISFVGDDWYPITETIHFYHIKVAYKETPPVDRSATDFVTVNSLCGLDRVFEKEMKGHMKKIFLNL